MKTNKQKIVEITLLENDALRVLQDITRGAIGNLEQHIIGRLKSERLMSGDPVDCGLSIHNIAESNGLTTGQVAQILFPNIERSEEIPELLKVIFLFGTGADHPCPDCGCELERETDGIGDTFWDETKCSNPECEFRDTTEPDHDIFPGGHAFDN